MDWTLAIERQRTALGRLLATLLAMAGLAGDLEPAGGPRRALPRHLHRAVLRLLRPAEAAARRLVIAIARSLPGTPPAGMPARVDRPARGGSAPGSSAPGNSVLVISAHPTALSLPLLDPLPRRPLRRISKLLPRVSVPGVTLPPPPSRPPLLPDDPVDAGRLHRRLRALARALDDLPAAARRFARWRGARDAALRAGDSRARRVWPLRPGRPPGWSRLGPDAVREMLEDAQWLARQALEQPDTS